MKTVVRFFVCVALSIVFISVVSSPVLSSTSATITGRVTDSQGLVVPGAQVQATNILTNINYNGETNEDGLYRISNLPPGEYRVIVQKQGFASIAKPSVELHVQDIITLNFAMQVGSVTQTITVEAGAPLINAESATVSTVVNREFVEDLPLNGRSFQTLFTLTPGVVLTVANFSDPGQFSANGQRASANYFTVDGVSANIGITPFAGLGQGASGSTPGFSVLGGTNNLVSVDALQEFRIQTSTYAPEFGRTPGAQVSIVTRSGTNELHGTLFEYLRNDVLDANDWFANQKGLPKPSNRQSDFGGTVSGPIVKNKTFYFFSYEGLRLRLPQTGITLVPSVSARQSASPVIRPFLDVFPIPNGPDLGNGQAEFNASFSDESTLNSTSIRIDHAVSKKLLLFGRYSYSPSELQRRGAGGTATLNNISVFRVNTQTVTVGSTWAIGSQSTNDLRLNYSRNSATGRLALDDFGGAVPISDASLFPSPFSSQDSVYSLGVLGLGTAGNWILGKNANHLQRQFNLVESFSFQKGSHALKFGTDYRRLSPRFGPAAYLQQVVFLDVPSVVSATPLFAFFLASREGTILLNNLGVFAQDTWKATSRLTLTYGLRWEIDFSPSTSDGPNLLSVTGIDSPSTLTLAPDGTAPFKTKYSNVAPRVGLALQLRRVANWETVLRGGFGVFYDLATKEVGDATFGGAFPFGAQKFLAGGLTFPLGPPETDPPAISRSFISKLVAFDPEVKLPYTLQWNVALEQSLGRAQALSLSYVASVGRRLLQTDSTVGPSQNVNYFFGEFIRNGATSDYHSLQLQFQKRLSHRVQALASYTWSHSIDTASSSSFTGSNTLVKTLGPQANRGPSDFDLRHSFSAAVSYDVPAARTGNPVVHAILRDWSFDNIILARSAAPVQVRDSQFFTFLGSFADVRPDVVPGVPLYVTDGSVAGGGKINRAAFTPPPVDPLTGSPLRQGTLGRNALRGFGAVQWDFSIRRRFHLTEKLRLQFRAEFFNLLNHPNFSSPEGDLQSPFFGQSTSMLARGLGGGQDTGGGGFVPLYQIGGPRSIQVALKLQF